MMDSGIRGGADIGRALSSGADFTFLEGVLCMVSLHWEKKVETIPFLY